MNTIVEMIKKLRDETGASVMDCRRALEQSNQDMEQAREILREAAVQRAEKRADHETRQGRVELYSHSDGRIGVMVEIHTESDFASRSEPFRRFSREIALQITSESPLYVSDEEIPQPLLDELAQSAAEKAVKAGKPERIIDRIAAGVVEKYKNRYVLLRQGYLRDESISVEQLLKQISGQIGEKIMIRRFQRWEIEAEAVQD